MSDYQYEAGLKAGSTEGQLSSSYSAWMQSEVKAHADGIAAALFGNGSMTLDAATALRTALQTGNFTVSDLLLAGQTKTGVVGDLAGTPRPMLHVNGQDIDLTQFMSDHTDTISWAAGSGKSAVTQIREVLDHFSVSTNGVPGWDNPNHAPAVVALVGHMVEGAGSKSIDLLAGATDQDGDALSVVDGSLTVVSYPGHANVNLPFDAANFGENGVWATIQDGKLVVDQNSPVFDFLSEGTSEAPIVLSYQVSDGHGGFTTNTITLDVTGTNDLPTVEALKIGVTETQSIYNAQHQIQNTGADIVTIDLLGGAKDVDSLDTLSVVNLDALPPWAKLAQDGHTLEIDRNGFDLKDGQHDSLVLNFGVNDGHATVANTLTIDLTGTLDQYHTGSQDATLSQSFTKAQGNLNDQSFSFSLPNDGGFDYHYSGSLAITGTGLDGNEKYNVVDFDVADGGFTLQVRPDQTTDGFALSNAALSDHAVDFNVNWSGQTEPTDTVKVDMTYHADWWIAA